MKTETYINYRTGEKINYPMPEGAEELRAMCDSDETFNILLEEMVGFVVNMAIRRDVGKKTVGKEIESIRFVQRTSPNNPEYKTVSTRVTYKEES